MSASRETAEPATFLNPVHSVSFPDPFVFKFGGHYYGYSTGFADDGKVFSVIHSSDLFRWTAVGGAMKPLDNSPPYYWAPEVSYYNGRFYLYYSVGNEVLMELRVAVSDRPDGGFIDSGRRLTTQDFAIDAHVFTDDDGQRYMFYATDFLEHTHIGTGTVVDRLLDPFTLEGAPRPVTRAKYDWQIYDPNRKEKGGVRWHTVEGPAVLKRKGLYYEMFSGGNWQNTTYGVSFAMTDDISAPEEWGQFSDGERVLPILRTLPDLVIGPGHNSVVRGPNNRELYCVYHRWVDGQRVMAIDRMDFAGDRIFVVGPSHTPQLAPYTPEIRETFRSKNIAPNLVATGGWSNTEHGFVSNSTAHSELRLSECGESFLLEFCVVAGMEDGSWGISIGSATGSELRLELHHRSLEVTCNGLSESRTMPPDFDPEWAHLFRIDVDCRRISVRVDEVQVSANVYLDSPVTELTIFSDHHSITIASLEMTAGFEELFETDLKLEENGWVLDGVDSHRIEGGGLTLDAKARGSLTKGGPNARLEFAANLRTAQDDGSGSNFGIELRTASGDSFLLDVDVGRHAVVVNGVRSPLPPDVQLTQFHQLRIVKRSGSALAYFDDVELGEFPVDSGAAVCAVYSDRTKIAIEMIRLTAI